MVHFLGLVSRLRLRTGHLRSVSGSIISARDAGQTALFIHHQSLRSSYSGFPRPYRWLLGGQIITFLQGAKRMNPPRPRTVPPWDLTTVLRALKGPLFEPLKSSSLRVLSLKTTLLLVYSTDSPGSNPM